MAWATNNTFVPPPRSLTPAEMAVAAGASSVGATLPPRSLTPTEIAANGRINLANGLIDGAGALALHGYDDAAAPAAPFTSVRVPVGGQGSAGLLGFTPPRNLNAAVAAVVPITPPPLPQTPQSNTGGVAPPPSTIGAVNADGSAAVAVGRLTWWQLNNQGLDTFLRVGLPIAGYFLWKAGHATVGVVAVSGSAVLWANRVEGLNL